MTYTRKIVEYLCFLLRFVDYDTGKEFNLTELLYHLKYYERRILVK